MTDCRSENDGRTIQDSLAQLASFPHNGTIRTKSKLKHPLMPYCR